MKCQICKALTPFAGVPHISISVPSSMRLIRAQILPNPNHGLRRLLHPLVREVCEGGRGSARISRHRCGRFFSTVAVSSSDDAKNIQRGQKRLPKLERRIMVESFVNGYRTLNAGKFPTITAAQKEVGGSFYVIREILQDLEYNFVHNPGVGMNGNSLVEKKGGEDIIIPEREFSRAEEVSCSHSRGESHLFEVEKVSHAEVKVYTRDMQVSSDEIEIGVEKTVELEVERLSGTKEVDGPPLSGGLAGDVSTDQKIMREEPERLFFMQHSNHLSDDDMKKHFESRKMLEMASFSEKSSLGDTSNPINEEDKDEFLTGSNSMEAEGSSVPCRGETVLVDEKDAKSGQGFVKPNISTSSLTDDNYDGLRETSTENFKDNDPQVNPSIWTNLKSFADNVFSMWRKR